LRVAALYDVHGNLPALEAVLAAAAGADLIVVGGDVVGGAFDAEALERLRAEGDRVRWLRGNAERELREGELNPALSGEQVDFLYGLPQRVELELPGLGHVLFCHATPHNDIDMVTPLTPDQRLRRILEGVLADVVVAGHTHVQQDRRVGGVRWVNAGSVGMAYEDEPGAYWALLGPDVELRRTEYDAAKLGGYEYPQASRQEAAEYFESLVRD
jgi:putative phosphoesterase